MRELSKIIKISIVDYTLSFHPLEPKSKSPIKSIDIKIMMLMGNL
jgi:hypothetical protein